MKRSHFTRVSPSEMVKVECDDRDQLWLSIGSTKVKLGPDEAIMIGMDLVREGRLLREGAERGWTDEH